MIEIRVKISSINEIETFKNISETFESDVYLSAGRYYVDAKSLLGIYSLDLNLPLTLVVDKAEKELVEKRFKDFLAD